MERVFVRLGLVIRIFFGLWEGDNVAKLTRHFISLSYDSSTESVIVVLFSKFSCR